MAVVVCLCGRQSLSRGQVRTRDAMDVYEWSVEEVQMKGRHEARWWMLRSLAQKIRLLGHLVRLLR